jgi:glucokinase
LRGLPVGRVVIGVDLGGTNVRTAVLNRDGEVLARHKEATNVAEGKEKVIARLVAFINGQREFASREGHSVAAVGVGSPGVILSEKGIVVKSPNFPDWNNLPLRQRLEEALDLPVVIENDANAAALGEQWLGAGRRIRTMILITLGTGVGGGIVLDRKLWSGTDGMAGEIGHMTLFPDGRQCSCGNRGCLEMYASARGIVMNYGEELEKDQVPQSDPRRNYTAVRIYDAARGGDARAASAMRRMGRHLGIGLASLINIFNPEMIVIGGGVKESWDLFIADTRDEVRKRAFAYPAERTDIVPAVLGDDAGMVGAAALALRKTGLA